MARLKGKTYFYFLISSFLFGSLFLFSKLLFPPLNAFTYLLLRMSIGGFVLFLQLIFTKQWNQYVIFFKANIKDLLITSTFFNLIPLVLVFQAMSYTTATNVLFIQSFSLIFIMFVQSVFYKQSTTKLMIISAIINVSGLLLMITPLSFSNPHILGDFMVLLSTFFSAFSVIYQKKITKKSNGLFFIFSTTWLSATYLLIIVLFGGLWHGILELNINQWLIIVWLGVSISWLAYLLNARIYEDKNITAEIIGIFFGFTPTVGLILGITLFGEKVVGLHLIGAILVILSIFLSQSGKDVINKEVETSIIITQKEYERAKKKC